MHAESEQPTPARRLPPAVWVPALIALTGALLYVFSTP